MVLLVCLSAFLILLGVIYLTVLLINRAEVRRFRAWADEHGWQVSTRLKARWIRRLPGHYKREVPLALSTVIDGWPVTVARYRYRSIFGGGGHGEGGGAESHRFVVAVLTTHRHYRPIGVHRRNLISRAARSVPLLPVTGLGDRRFDHDFQITSASSEHARRIIPQALVDAHLVGEVPLWSVDGDELLAYWEDTSLHDPADAPWFADALVRVAYLLEPHAPLPPETR